MLKKLNLALAILALCAAMFTITGCNMGGEEDHRGDKVIDDIQYPDKTP